MDRDYEYEELVGTVISVVYKNDESGYTVLSVRDENEEKKTVVGLFPFVVQGERIVAQGFWVNHPVHGEQFKAELITCIMPKNENDIFDFLSGGAIKGVGPATASLMVNEFGTKTLDIIENFPEKLTILRGISKSKAEQISTLLKQQTGIRRMIEYFCSFGLRPSYALRLNKYYGDRAFRLVQSNPYILCSDQIGASFGEADNVALEMGFELYSDERIEAAALHELSHNSGNGHCFIPAESLINATCQLISCDYEHVEKGLGRLIEHGRVISETIRDINACYLPELYDAETTIAYRLAEMNRDKYEIDIDLEQLVSRLEEINDICYAPKQRSILDTVLKNKVAVITGGPGTGKTTSISAILSMFDVLGLRTLITAPTGRAAKRVTELSGREATTVHRLLEARISPEGDRVVFNKNEADLLDCDAVILDESSMVDIPLLAALLRAMPDESRLIIVGDVDQLPPVGPGNALRAIIDSGIFPVIRLTDIFRQNESSRIISYAHMINRGEYPDFSVNKDGFFRLKRFQAASSVETIIELFSVRLPQNINVSPKDIQVLSPTRKGKMGTVNLNSKLQEVLNPPAQGKKEKSFGDVFFRVGDRVMQIKNNYDLLWTDNKTMEQGFGVFNGDIGEIISIDNEFQKLVIDFDGRVAVYPFEALNDLEHAWAITVHKSQGSEYKAVILSLSPSSKMLLTRDVLYTAVTRAREMLIMVGDESVAVTMIDNYKRSNRYSFLKTRLLMI